MLRHTYATHTLVALQRNRAGNRLEPLVFLRKQLGHASPQSTLVYLHLIQELADDAALAYDGKFEELAKAADGKRRAFVRSDLSTPAVEHARDAFTGNVVLLPDRVPPVDTVVRFSNNAAGARTFDFAAWYGVGIDELTYVCLRQIERFADRQDMDIEPTTTVSYCQAGLRPFFDSPACSQPHLSDRCASPMSGGR